MSQEKSLWYVLLVLALFPALLLAGNPSTKYTVLPPISGENLTIYPVASSVSHNTSSFMTLDEGIRNGSVVVTESGQATGLVRRPGHHPRRSPGGEVNRLVLLNNSDRPLLLLAGEIVTGGKQDRVIGSDRIVPPNSDPVDLSVFCVEPGRWVARSEKFAYMGSQMAQPSIRMPAMNEKSQTEVWDNVRKSSRNAALAAPSAAPAIAETTSYAGVMENKQVRDKLETVAAPIDRDYTKLIRELKQQNAVGVVVAVNGEIVWADLFASTELLADYWPKLIRSYAAEAVTGAPRKGVASQHSAQDFVDSLAGNREIVETEPGVYRRAEITGDGYKVFSLTSLLPKTDFTVHLAKMSDDSKNHVVPTIE